MRHSLPALSISAGAACSAPAPDDDAEVPSPVDGYLFQSLIDGPDGRTAYLQHFLRLPSGAVANADALEVPGNGRVYVYEGRAWAGSGDAPVITPLRLGPAVVPVAGLAVSLAESGASAAPFGHAFLADGSLALFTDVITVLDPIRMELRQTWSLDDVRVDGRTPDLGPGVRQGDRILVPAVYKAFPNVDPAVHVVVLDAWTGEPRTVWSDPRGWGTGGVAVASDGTAYISSDLGYRLPDFGSAEVPPTRLLQIAADQEGFLGGWTLDLRAATGGLDATGFRLLDDETALIFVLDPDLLPDEAQNDASLYYSAAASRWWRLNLRTGRASSIADLPAVPSGSGVSSALSDSSALVALPTSFPAVDNRFARVRPSGPPEPSFSFTGRGVVVPLHPHAAAGANP
jgi:hypothetical protein